jgi:hypothetical protein
LAGCGAGTGVGFCTGGWFGGWVGGWVGGGVGGWVGGGVGEIGALSGRGVTLVGFAGSVGWTGACPGSVNPLASRKAIGGSKEPKRLGAQVDHAGSRAKIAGGSES